MSKSWWRKAAREVINAELDQAHEEDIHDVDELIRRIDGAYPFVERERWPYKCWLIERRLTVLCLKGIAADREEAEKVLALPKHLKVDPELEAWLKKQGVA